MCKYENNKAACSWKRFANEKQEISIAEPVGDLEG